MDNESFILFCLLPKCMGSTVSHELKKKYKNFHVLETWINEIYQ